MVPATTSIIHRIVNRTRGSLIRHPIGQNWEGRILDQRLHDNAGRGCEWKVSLMVHFLRARISLGDSSTFRRPRIMGNRKPGARSGFKVFLTHLVMIARPIQVLGERRGD